MNIARQTADRLELRGSGGWSVFNWLWAPCLFATALAVLGGRSDASLFFRVLTALALVFMWQKPTQVIILSRSENRAEFCEGWRSLAPRRLASCRLVEIERFSIRVAEDPETQQRWFYLDAIMADGLRSKLPPVLVYESSQADLLPHINRWLKGSANRTESHA